MSLQASFTYRFDEEFFTETVNFATPIKEGKADLDDTIIDTFLKHIHIAIGISYYKLFPKAEIIVPDWRDEEMLNFWKKFYLNGLGEFMVVNGLSPKEVARFAVKQSLLPSHSRTGTRPVPTPSNALLFF
ncbi:MAG: hypothetical protein LBD11_07685 [Candidatus Peribacteria bacterium]|nr:hypothetical protein [Candidatus Peribacteria bacterium]